MKENVSGCFFLNTVYMINVENARNKFTVIRNKDFFQVP